jgi:hypothetical protein
LGIAPGPGFAFTDFETAESGYLYAVILGKGICNGFQNTINSLFGLFLGADRSSNFIDQICFVHSFASLLWSNFKYVFLLKVWRHHTFEDGIIQAKSFPEAILPQYFLAPAQWSCLFTSTVL